MAACAGIGGGGSALYDAGSTLDGVLDTAAVEANADGSRTTFNPATGAIANGAGGCWWVDGAIYDSGTVSSWSNNQKPNHTAKAWSSGQWWGYSALVTADAATPGAVGQVQDIVTNTGTALITNTFTTLPDAGAGYRIYRRSTIDGIHPATWSQQAMAGVLTAAYGSGVLR